MSADTRLDSLLAAWQQARARGTDVPAAELCRDCPELLSELEQQIAVLRKIDALNATREPPVASVGDAVTVTGPGDHAETLVAPAPAPPGFVIESELGRGG